MSQGPYISVFEIEGDRLDRETKRRMVDLMRCAEYGDEEERVCVAEHINSNLGPPMGKLFAYWNHRPGQEVEDYDDLVEYFKLYGKILANEKRVRVIVGADFYDEDWMYDEQHEYVLDHDDRINNRDWFSQLELKKQVRDGKEAQERLEQYEQEGETAE